MILSADNELAPATFAARIAASAGSDIFSCVTTALGAFEGMLTGVGCDEAEATLRQAGNAPDKYVALLAGRIHRKSPLAGYNHPLYPDGDPRARLLMDIARRIVAPDSPGAVGLACIDEAQAQLSLKPNLPLGLLSVGLALEAPSGAAGAIMALGRTAGWIDRHHERAQPRGPGVVPRGVGAGVADGLAQRLIREFQGWRGRQHRGGLRREMPGDSLALSFGLNYA